MSKCDKVKLSELIIQKTDTEQIVDIENEHYITLSLYGKGARERVIKDGKYPVPFTGYRVSEGQFIYSRIDARNGAYDIIGPELDGFVVSKDFPVFDINESRVLPHFLRRAVLSDAFINQVKNSSFGATNRMRIKEDIFAGYSIPLPELSKQKEIVDILDRAETIINSRRQEMKKLDDLIKARFVEMFGDPVVHLHKGETVKLDTIADKITVGFVGEASNEYVDEGVPYLRTQNVRVNRIDLKGLIYVNESFHNKNQKSIIHPGDVVISRVGANRGMAAMVPNSLPEANIANCLIVGQTDNINSYYLAFYLNMSFGKRPQFGASVGSAQGVVNTSILKKWEVYVPDRKLQDDFFEFSNQVDKSKLLEERQVGFIAKKSQKPGR